MENQKHIEAYQELFDHMANEHELTLLQSELDEIIRLSKKTIEKYNEASEGKDITDELPDGNCNKPHVTGSASIDFKKLRKEFMQEVHKRGF